MQRTYKHQALWFAPASLINFNVLDEMFSEENMIKALSYLTEVSRSITIYNNQSTWRSLNMLKRLQAVCTLSGCGKNHFW